jgi:hypothetical protein
MTTEELVEPTIPTPTMTSGLRFAVLFAYNGFPFDGLERYASLSFS